MRECPIGLGIIALLTTGTGSDGKVTSDAQAKFIVLVHGSFVVGSICGFKSKV